MLIKVRKKPGGSHISKDALEVIKVSFGDTLRNNENVEGTNVSFVGYVLNHIFTYNARLYLHQQINELKVINYILRLLLIYDL